MVCISNVEFKITACYWMELGIGMSNQLEKTQGIAV